MAKFLMFLVFFAVFIFIVGFLSGYFLERTAIAYSQSKINELKNEIENMQIQEMFMTGEQVDCKLLYSTMNTVSNKLYIMVEQLKASNPETQEFYDMKRDADFLSLRAWIISRNIKQRCAATMLPILYIYSTNQECEEQDQILQSTKKKYAGVLVYAIDFHLNESAVQLVKNAYEIKSTPSMIINHQLYGKLSQEELEQIVCQNINCTETK